MWLLALDRDVEGLARQLENVAAAREAAAAARMEPPRCEEGVAAAVATGAAADAALLQQALGDKSESAVLHEIDGAHALPQWPSLSISEGGDSGAPISSDSDDEGEDGGGVGGSIMLSCLDKSVMGEEMLAACVRTHGPAPPLVSLHDVHAAAHEPPCTPPWAEDEMFKVAQLANAAACALAPPQEFSRQTPHLGGMGMQALPELAPMSSMSQTMSASESCSVEPEHDPLPVQQGS
jgi:hypothetical protein